MIYNTKEFKELQAKWYKKLRESGFNDIEKNEFVLLEPTKGLAMTAEETATYFRLAKKYLESGEFESLFGKTVWFLHTEGCTGREIATILNRSTATVSRTIAAYEKKALAK